MALAPLALGCGNFGGLGSSLPHHGQGLDQAQAFALMDAAWELGIRHFDTSDAYGGGRSELMIGAWIRARGVRPAITTKTLSPLTVDGDRGLGGERIRQALPRSLERLGVDRVDVYLAHGFDSQVPLSETMGAFEELRAGGLTGIYGVSNFNAEQLANALAAGSPAVIQNSYSLLVREDEAAVLPLCAARGVEYMAFSPLAGGWLTGKYRAGAAVDPASRLARAPGPYERFQNPETFARIEALDESARRAGMSLAGLAMAWLMAVPGVTQVITGPVKVEHLAPIREAIEHPLTAAERMALTELMA